MNWFKKIIKGLRFKKLHKGGGICWSSGKAFDPRDQKRTTPMEDFNRAKREKDNKED